MKDNETTQINYDGYELVWQDDFDGTELNRNDWNVELHEPGWVNEEWQRYVDSEENIKIKDSRLILIPVKKVDKDGANMIITVNRPINKDYAAGTVIAIQKSGAYYYSSYVKPGAKDKAFQHPLKKVNFWKKTAYISPMILVNWGLPAKADKSKLETIYKDMKLTIKEIK